MSSEGRRLLSAIVADGSIKSLIGISPDLFKDGEKPLFDFVAAHVGKYGKVPSAETIEEHVGDVLVATSETVEYYLEQCEKRYTHNSLKAAVLSMQDFLKAADSDKALKTMLEVAAELHQRKHKKNLFDFRQIADLIYADYKTKQLGDEDGRVLFGWPTLDAMTNGIGPGDFVAYVGRPAAGKAQPLTAKVLTTSGWVMMGDLKVGDQLASVDGAKSEVTAIYPQGVKPVFRVTFQDGRSTEAADEHLWEVWSREWDTPKVVTTVQLAALLTKARYQKRLSVRMFNGEYGTELPMLVDPYVLGLLIGDGCFRGSYPTFASEDQELISALAEGVEHLGLKVIHADRCNYRLCGENGDRNQLKEWLGSMGLWGKKSEQKNLPGWVFRLSRTQRIGLLQGLMGSDGTSAKNGGVSFATSSPMLAKDVQMLVWSLGGRASICQKTTNGLLAYILHVVFQDRTLSFRLERKRDRVSSPRTTHTNTRLRIDSVEFLREDECQCISVSHPDKLYVTDDYVVTHNTFLGLYSSLRAWESGMHTPLFVSMEMMNIVIAQRLAAMHTAKNLTKLMKALMTTKSWVSMMEKLEAAKDAERPLWCVDGNLMATPDDITMLCRQTQPSLVVVDGAYLLRSSNPKASKFEKITENAEALKQRVATDLGIPVIASYQLNREATKKLDKNKESVGLEDIYGSDAIGQLATVVLGLFEEDGVETQHHREVDIMKGRNGERGRFKINWGFDTMDFSEVLPESANTPLQFL